MSCRLRMQPIQPSKLPSNRILPVPGRNVGLLLVAGYVHPSRYDIYTYQQWYVQYKGEDRQIVLNVG